MSRHILAFLWPLIVLNVLAIGLWLVASRWRIVLITPVGRGPREIGSLGSGLLHNAMRGVADRTATAARSMRLIWASLVARVTLVSQRAMRPSRTSRAPVSDPRSEGLDAWIDEVEQQETRAPDQRPTPATDAVSGAADGSAAWWKAFAESGGALPGAAESCRRPGAAAVRKTAIL